MNARHPDPIGRRLVALALALVFAGALAAGRAEPAAADSSQWLRTQPHWWDQTGDWRAHKQWQWHRKWPKHGQRRDFGGLHRCFGGCGPRVVIGGSGVFFASPGLIVAPRFAARQPVFIVRRPAFAIQPPRFVVVRPSFAVRQSAFVDPGPWLHVGKPHWGKPHWGKPRWGKPRWHKAWEHGSGPHGHQPASAGGKRILAPGMN